MSDTHEREVQNCRSHGGHDGVFSMNGDIAPLDEIVDLCDRYDAILMVDDSHGTGYMGRTGRAPTSTTGVMGRWM